MIHWLRSLFVFLLVSSSCFGQEKDHQLDPSDIHGIMRKIFSRHVEKKEISQQLVSASFEQFINQFDPSRIYLLESEVSPYLNLSQEKANTILLQYQNNNFSEYVRLNELFQQAIQRARPLRLEIEKKFLEGKQKPVPLENLDMYPLPFAKNTDMLKQHTIQQLSQFLLLMQQRYGPTLVEKEMKEFIADYEDVLRRKENAYLYQTIAGAPLPKAEEDNLFTLHLLKALARSLDKHTTVLSETESESFRIDLEQEYSGLGIIFEKRHGDIFVTDVIENSPASESEKVQKGDLLLKIDGSPVTEQNWRQKIENLRGPEGSWVELTLQKPEKGEAVVRLQRQPITLASKQIDTSYETFGNGILATIGLHSFYRGEHGSSSQDLRRALHDLEKAGPIRGLVLDLRGNTGGFLSEAIRVAGLFITNGIIVISREGEGTEKIYRDVDPSVSYQGPMIVLTSEGTASAAEIVAQALQDYGVAVVVGEEQTYGKGTIQTHSEFENEGLGRITVTVGQYYTVSGRSPQGSGVPVDVVLPTLLQGREKRQEEVVSAFDEEKIPPQYLDSLKDVPKENRSWYMQYYVPTMQRQSGFWRKQIPLLQKNSQLRIKDNKNYQLYLKGELTRSEDDEEEESFEETASNYGEEDLMINEAFEILKDMVLIESNLRREGLKSANLEKNH